MSNKQFELFWKKYLDELVNPELCMKGQIKEACRESWKQAKQEVYNKLDSICELQGYNKLTRNQILDSRKEDLGEEKVR